MLDQSYSVRLKVCGQEGHKLLPGHCFKSLTRQIKLREPGLFSPSILTVTDLTRRLAGLIDKHFAQVKVVGEISNLRQPGSGHLYFVLKDEQAQIRAVMFRLQQRYLSFEPADGQEVVLHGRLTVYEPRGEYQIIVDYMEPHGEGALRLALEKLKAKLAAEGLFDSSRKKSLPYLPGRVAIVTSPTGAAVRDFIRVAFRRFDRAWLSIYPVRVQGQGAAEEIARAVAQINTWGGFDVIVLTRGGGSLEDLWAFNEEVLARAVAGSAIPVVSAVGHEIDFTIADLVSDLRAPTPSAAAEMIFRDQSALLDLIDKDTRRLVWLARTRLALGREKLDHRRTSLSGFGRSIVAGRLRLDHLSETLLQGIQGSIIKRRYNMEAAQARLAQSHPRQRLRWNHLRLEGLSGRIHRQIKESTDRWQGILARHIGRLHDLSPLTVLQRGYAIVRHHRTMAVIRSTADVEPGERLLVNLAQGQMDVIVEEVIL